MPITATALRAAALTVSLAVLLAAGCSGGDGDPEPRASGLSGLARQQPRWTPCPAPSEAEGGGPSPSPLPDGSPWECSFMEVPLDYGDPDGKRIELALIRARAMDEQRRIGSLLFNFGGPGGSGVAALPNFAADYADLRTRYDLVSFDPRGVGRSVPVECESDRGLDSYLARDMTPDTTAEEKEFRASVAGYTDACEDRSGDELPHVGTLNAARDMDLIRGVLREEKLHYFGISYGTELGGVYAHLFPARVGRAVLDAAVDPTKTSEQSALGQAKGFQLALDNFSERCAQRGAECPLPGSDAAEIQDGVKELLARLDRRPIPGIGDRMLTQSLATTGIASALYSEQNWEYLEQGLEAADGGDGGLLLTFADALNGRSETGHYDNSGAANTAVNCADYRGRYDTAAVKQRLPAFRKVSPVFGDYLGWGLLSCDGWPVAGAWNTPDVSAPGAPPIVVIGTTGDPATPYEGARALAGELGPGVGVELTFRGEGHGAYNSGDGCVRRAVNGYLLDGKVPADGTVCP
jgi:pimeloyl-ACP methyl ester carboxylesterase